ncbi:PilZ domain-containing protein [Rhizobium tarimense]|nr:PilZ domain-containing protein [Pseudorhizobium tarimense]MCJ8517518.1 PilZ domain-containing protein [Pseudorhizobium tarimense]
MLATVTRMLLSVSLLAVVAGCSSSSPTAGLSAASAPAAEAATPVVQAFCPPVVMREETAIYRSYARGGQDNPEKLAYQASLAEATRQCTANESTITINVVAQGRIVAGPAVSAGQVNLPVLVEVVDGDNVIYSQKVSFPVELPTAGTQFIFSKPDVQIPNAQGGASRFTRVRLGFDIPSKN